MKKLIHVLLLIVLTIAVTPSEAASYISNLRVRSDNSPVPEGRVFAPPGPVALAFTKPSGTLWSGNLTKDGSVVVNRENSSGWSTPEFSCGNLAEGTYALNIRLLGNPTKTTHFTVRRDPPPTPAPCITVALVDQQVNEGQNVAFSAAYGCAPVSSTSWLKDGEDLGVAGASLSIPSVGPDDAGTYTFVARGQDGQEARTSATLTVFPPAPKVSVPATVEVVEGDSINITATISGEADTVFWINQTGQHLADGEMLSFDSSTPSSQGTYTCVAQGHGGEGRASCQVTLLSPAKFILKPADVGIFSGGTATFSVHANGTSPINVQWYRITDEAKLAIPGANREQFIVPRATEADAGTYHVEVSNPWGTDEAEANLTVIVSPFFVSVPANQTVFAGGTLSVSAQAGGTAPLVFTWIKPSGQAVPGQTGSSLDLPSVGTECAGSWTVRVRRAFGAEANASFIVTVSNPPPVDLAAGSFSGLFYDSEAVTHESSGAANLAVSGGKLFTGKLTLGLKQFRFSGQFTAGGTATCQAIAAGDRPLQLQLSVENDDLVTGQVSGDGWTTDLLLDRTVFNKAKSPCPLAGTFTLDLPPNESFPNAPAGDGYASISVNQDGIASLSGKLADGTPFVAKFPMSRDAVVPFYLPLYAGNVRCNGFLDQHLVSGWS